MRGELERRGLMLVGYRQGKVRDGRSEAENQVADWEGWPGCWCGGHSNQVAIEACVQYIGTGGGKKDGRDLAAFVAGPGARSWIVTRAKAKGKRFGKDGGWHGCRQGWKRRQGPGKGKGRAMARAACGRFAWVVGPRSIIKGRRKNTDVQRVDEDIPEVLFIGFVQNRGALMDTPGSSQISQTCVAKKRTRFWVPEADDPEGEEIANVRQNGKQSTRCQWRVQRTRS